MAADAVLLFSDVHFDPFADPALVPALAATDVSGWKAIFEASGRTGYAAYGSDANYALFASALDDMAARAGGVDLILYPGDILSHDFGQTYAALTGDASQAGLDAFIQKTVSFFVAEVDSRFPEATVLAAIGNNDSALGDYGSRPGDPYLAGAAQVMGQAFFNTDADRTAFAASFAMGGYYALEPDGPTGVKYLVVNDVFWSTHAADPGPGILELAWFQAELADAARDFQKVWVVTHIPPGADAYATANAAATTGQIAYSGDLADPCNNAFVGLSVAYAGSIQASFAGHIHRDDFRLLAADPASAPVGLLRVALSVSPVYDNNPGYQVFTLDDRTGGLADAATFVLDLGAETPAWGLEYDYAAAYGQTLATPREWTAVYAGIAADPVSRAAYTAFHNGSATSQADITAATLPVYWLAIGQATPASFAAVAGLAAV